MGCIRGVPPSLKCLRDRRYPPILWVFFLTVGSAIAWVPQFSGLPAKSSVRLPSTCCHMFVRPSNTKPSSMEWKVPSGTLDFCRPTELPWTIELEPSPPWRPESGCRNVLTVRRMQIEDLDAIVEMCIQEYGSGPADFPLRNPLLLGAWLDRQYLRWLVDLSSRAKLLWEDSKKSIGDDHVILVAALNNDDSDEGQTIVGMIEISLQPQIPERTPPPFPVPLGVKRFMATLSTDNDALVGWITNLLIPVRYRGKGFSKALVVACEAVGLSWRCSSIHLHCDADPDRGRIPQKLYHRLGYRSPPSPSILESSRTSPPYIVDIEGVPLLYLYKDLSKAC